MSTEKDIDQLSIDTIRTLVIDAIQKSNSGHPGTLLDVAPVAYALWTALYRWKSRPSWRTTRKAPSPQQSNCPAPLSRPARQKLISRPGAECSGKLMVAFVTLSRWRRISTPGEQERL